MYIIMLPDMQSHFNIAFSIEKHMLLPTEGMCEVAHIVKDLLINVPIRLQFLNVP